MISILINGAKTLPLQVTITLNLVDVTIKYLVAIHLFSMIIRYHLTQLSWNFRFKYVW